MKSARQTPWLLAAVAATVLHGRAGLGLGPVPTGRAPPECDLMRVRLVVVPVSWPEVARAQAAGRSAPSVAPALVTRETSPRRLAVELADPQRPGAPARNAAAETDAAAPADATVPAAAALAAGEATPADAFAISTAAHAGPEASAGMASAADVPLYATLLPPLQALHYAVRRGEIEGEAVLS